MLSMISCKIDFNRVFWILAFIVTGSVSRPSFPGYLQSEAPSLASHFAASSSDTQAASGVLNEDVRSSLIIVSFILLFLTLVINFHLPSSNGFQMQMNSLRPGGYGLGSIPSVGVQPVPGLGVLSAAAGISGYSSLQNTLQHGEYGFSGTQSAVSHPEPSFIGESAAASRRGYSPLEDDAAAGINPVIPDITNERPSSEKNFNGPSAADGQSNLLFVDGLPTDCTRREIGRILFLYMCINNIFEKHNVSGFSSLVVSA